MDFRNIKTQLVELPVIIGSTLTNPKFPAQDFLRNKFIISIETFSVNDIAFAPSGNTLPTTANLMASFLTLYGQNPEAIDAQGITSSGDGQWLENIPLVSLHRAQNTVPDPFVRNLYILQPRVIVWEKSFVSLANGQVLGNSAPLSFVFLVGYIGNAGDSAT